MSCSTPRLLAAALVVVTAMLLLPAAASAHGPLDPEASANLARVIRTPPGVVAKVVDGDQRLWMSVSPSHELVVMDYQGGQYLRFDRAGVWVNERSPMFFLNQTPPSTPPANLTARVTPNWHLVSSGHSYEWHDGRISALASVLITPGTRYLGRWSIRVQSDGRPSLIVGNIYHAPPPSLAWLWPIALAMLTLPALLRLHDRRLERRVLRGVAWLSLVAAAVLAIGAGFHGRPGLSPTLLLLMAVQLALLGYAARALVHHREGPLTFALIALLAGYRGIAGIATLWRGFVLLALPGTLARAAVTICLAGGLSLALILVTRTDPAATDEPPTPGGRSELLEQGTASERAV